MTDTLRTRIAAAMYEQRRLVSRVPMLSDWAGAHPTVQKMWLATADAVIAELKLEVEDGECGYCRAQLPGCRYSTWKADDE